MGRRRAPVSDDIDAKTLHKYFEDKVDGLFVESGYGRCPTAYLYVCSDRLYIAHLRSFRSLAGDDIAKAVRMLPDKQCTSDPINAHWFI